MFRVHEATPAPIKAATHDLALHGIGWAATAVMFAATMVITFGAPI